MDTTHDHLLHHQEIVESLPGIAALFTPQGRIMFCNRRMLEYLDETLEQVQSKPSAYNFHPDDRDDVLTRWSAAVLSGEPLDIEARLRRADGVYLWHRTSVFPLRNAAGNIDVWYGLSTDIDQHMRARAQLAAEKRLLEHVALGAPLTEVLDALCREVESLSPASYCSILLVESSSKTFRVGAGPSLPESYNAVLDGMSIDPNYGPCSRAATTKIAVVTDDVEKDPRWSTSPWVDLMTEHGLKSCWSMPIVSGRQEVLGVFAIYRREPEGPTAREQTIIDRFTKIAGIALERAQGEAALKASEAELRRAYGRLTEAQRLSKTGSFTWDVRLDEHVWSEEIYRIFEFTADSTVTLEVIRSVIHPDDKSMVETVIASAVERGDIDVVFRVIARSGKVRHVHVVAHAIEHITDRPVFIGALRDLTESKAAEEALNRARAELAHVSRVATLSALTASIAHEVNQPLAGIITNADTCLRMLASDPPNLDGARTTAQRTIRDGNRASEVIERLRRMFARKQPTIEILDLNDAVREVLALSASELQGADVVVRTDFDQALCVVRGDRVQLQQVILNLVLNAADAMREIRDRPRRLTVRTARAASGEVILSVRDEGIGIERENLERVFNAFYTTKSKGMGIGLSISRSIIQGHEGSIWATPNDDGRGATFSFSIPCETPASDPRTSSVFLVDDVAVRAPAFADSSYAKQAVDT